ncbi:MAG TPA: hypothetical protein VFZ99_07340 [Terriglobales bacterium]
MNSWKEIGSYIGRGVRTVQRWEELYGLPVHRPAAKKRAAVLAFTDEVDAWLHKSSAEIMAAENIAASQALPHITESRVRFLELVERNRKLVDRFHGLMQRSAELQGSIIERATAAKSRMTADTARSSLKHSLVI